MTRVAPRDLRNDTFRDVMKSVTVREGRNHGGEVLDSVARGVVTFRSSILKPFAEISMRCWTQNCDRGGQPGDARCLDGDPARPAHRSLDLANRVRHQTMRSQFSVHDSERITRSCNERQGF